MARGYAKKLIRVAPPIILDPSVMVIPTKLNNLKVAPKKIVEPPPSTVYLESDYEPTDHDILCGRSRESFHHVGNRYLRTLVAIHLKRYIVGNRAEKTKMAKEVVNAVRESGGKFIKFDEARNLWFEIDEKGARSKVAHAFRDSLAHVRESLPSTSDGNDPKFNTSPKLSAKAAKREREWSKAHASQIESKAALLPQANLKSPPCDPEPKMDETAQATLKKAPGDCTPTKPAATTPATVATESPLDVLVRAMDFHRDRESITSSSSSDESVDSS